MTLRQNPPLAAVKGPKSGLFRGSAPHTSGDWQSGPEIDRIPQIGDTFGPWRLVHMLGEGEWTQVYQARPAAMSELSPSGEPMPADYAVKVLRSNRREDPVAMGLLAREAEVGQTVAHPHLISVLSIHIQRPPYYLVTPFILGATVGAALAAHGPMAAPHALWIARQTTQAIGALHESGWLHADVKPANILVAPEGHATLLDLGFARRLKTEECRSQQTLRGSLAYTAPETLSSALPSGATSDIYSLGVVLFEMLTGRRPFCSEDPTELAASHLQQTPPDPRTIRPELEAKIAELLRTMLAKEPLRRPTAEELVTRLGELEIETFDQRVV